MNNSKKWNAFDVIEIILEIVVPILSIVFSHYIKGISSDEKIAIIASGIVFPVVMLQFSLTKSQKSLEKKIEENGKK